MNKLDRKRRGRQHTRNMPSRDPRGMHGREEEGKYATRGMGYFEVSRSKSGDVDETKPDWAQLLAGKELVAFFFFNLPES